MACAYGLTGDCMKDSLDAHAVTIHDGTKWVVRRITPRESERLQGFPDGWTDIGDYIDTKGKKRKTSDSARYKALGNSIALPSWVWVLISIHALRGEGDSKNAQILFTVFL